MSLLIALLLSFVRVNSRYFGAYFLCSALVPAVISASDVQLPPGSRVWKVEATGATFALAQVPPAGSGMSVRNQIAGTLDAWSELPILPIEAGRTSLHGLPTYYLRMVLADGIDAKSTLLLIAFSENDTFVGSVISSDDVTFDYVESQTNFSGQTNAFANEVLDDVVRRNQEGMAKLQQLLRAKHSVVWDKFRKETRRGEQAVTVVKTKRGDLAIDESNAVELNRRLRERPPSQIYGWGAHRLSETEHSVTFIYEMNGRTVTLVWLVDSANSTAVNISTRKADVDGLRAEKKLNLPSSSGLMAYDPQYDMISFRNSDYYRGRGTDPLNRPLK